MFLTGFVDQSCFDMQLMRFDIVKQHFVRFGQYLGNIWLIFGHVLGNWAQGLAWGEIWFVTRPGPPGVLLLWNAE